MTTPLPTPRDFLLSIPVYRVFEYPAEDVWSVLDVIYFDGTYDNYCAQCGKESTFKVDSPGRHSDHDKSRWQKLKGVDPRHSPPFLPRSSYTVNARCTRQGGHIQEFIFLTDIRFKKNESGDQAVVRTFEKIGQHPSFGDSHLAKVKQYASVLSKTQLGELSRAINLASHDVGIGSYTYLRRVFETLVAEAHTKAMQTADWDEEAYVRSRMPEKIGLLRNQLPQFLGDHPEMYSILSKGIHELSEEECLAHFPTLKIGIELILDEKIEQRKREQKIREAKSAISTAMNAVSGRNVQP